MILSIEFVSITCCRSGCGLTFAVPERWSDDRRKDHLTFYCPNGHQQGFYGKTSLEKNLDIALAEKLRLESSLEFTRKQRDRAQKETIMQKGRATRFKNDRDRIKTRIANGVCPCCNRHFVNVERHMSTQHPKFKIPEAE